MHAPRNKETHGSGRIIISKEFWDQLKKEDRRERVEDSVKMLLALFGIMLIGIIFGLIYHSTENFLNNF